MSGASSKPNWWGSNLTFLGRGILAETNGPNFRLLGCRSYPNSTMLLLAEEVPVAQDKGHRLSTALSGGRAAIRK